MRMIYPACREHKDAIWQVCKDHPNKRTISVYHTGAYADAKKCVMCETKTNQVVNALFEPHSIQFDYIPEPTFGETKQ